MRFIVPYNEILPRKKAHDLFLFRECVELAKAGHDVHLLCGKGEHIDLFDHYNISGPLHIHRLPIIRKNNRLNLSWNLPFFIACQKMIKRLKPDIVLLSVLKQAIYHLNRRIGKTQYLYEAHELTSYPNLPRGKHFDREKIMMMQADRIIVTTEALKTLLTSPPYNLKTPIDVLPLAVDLSPLPPYNGPPTITYVGQLYKEQGIADLIEAAKHAKIHLQIIGGTEAEIQQLDPKLPHITFRGFVAPKDLPKAVANTTAFVAPFHLTGRMPYVAHTKLHEYAAWQRPIIAPDCPLTRSPGIMRYSSPQELTSCLNQIASSSELPPPPLSWAERISHLP